MVASRTKVQPSQAQIQGLVGEAFGGAELRSAVELTDGYFNTAYHVELDADPSHLVLKVGPRPDADILSYEADLMRAEVETMKLVATDPEIPVPRVRFADFSRTRLPVDYFFMDFVEGTSWGTLHDALSDEQNEAIEVQLGRITAHINHFERSTFDYPAVGPGFGLWADAFGWMCGLLFADARRYGVPLEPRKGSSSRRSNAIATSSRRSLERSWCTGTCGPGTSSSTRRGACRP